MTGALVKTARRLSTAGILGQLGVLFPYVISKPLPFHMASLWGLSVWSLQQDSHTSNIVVQDSPKRYLSNCPLYFSSTSNSVCPKLKYPSFTPNYTSDSLSVPRSGSCQVLSRLSPSAEDHFCQILLVKVRNRFISGSMGWKHKRIHTRRYGPLSII